MTDTSTVEPDNSDGAGSNENPGLLSVKPIENEAGKMAQSIATAWRRLILICALKWILENTSRQRMENMIFRVLRALRRAMKRWKTFWR